MLLQFLHGHTLARSDPPHNESCCGYDCGDFAWINCEVGLCEANKAILFHDDDLCQAVTGCFWSRKDPWELLTLSPHFTEGKNSASNAV